MMYLLCHRAKRDKPGKLTPSKPHSVTLFKPKGRHVKVSLQLALNLIELSDRGGGEEGAEMSDKTLGAGKGRRQIGFE